MAPIKVKDQDARVLPIVSYFPKNLLDKDRSIVK